MRKRAVPGLLMVLLCAGCAAAVKPVLPPIPPGTPSYTGPPLVRWVFEDVVNNGEPYTRTFLVVAGRDVSTYTIGTFYGGVARVMIRGQEGGDMLPEDALSGFIVFIAGAGHEVYAGYNLDDDVLYIKSRRIREGGVAEPFSTIKIIPMQARGTPVPVR